MDGEKDMEIGAEEESTSQVHQQSGNGANESTRTNVARRQNDSSPDRTNKRFMTDDGFILIKNSTRTLTQAIPKPITTQNRFQPLQNDTNPPSTSTQNLETSTQETANQDDSQPQQHRTNPQRPKIGPFRLDLDSLHSATDMTKEMMKVSNNQMTAKCNRTQLLIQPLTMTAYHKIKDRLDEISTTDQKDLFFIKVSYSFNRATDEIHDKIVIKGLPPGYGTDRIKMNLDYLKIKYYHVTEMNRREKDGHLTPLGIFTVETNKKDMTETKDKLRYIDDFKIKLEDYKTNDHIPQCKRCQRLYHTKTYCRRPVTCALCAQPHATEDCPSLTHDLPNFVPTCANCKRNHPAFDPICPHITHAKEIRSQQTLKSQPIQPPQMTYQNFPHLSSRRNTNRSYSSALTNEHHQNSSSQNPPPQNQHDSSQAQNLKDIFTLLQSPTLKKILPHLRTLITILTGPEDIITKLINAGIKLIEILN